METLFRWIHLSDIHVGHGDAGYGWDQKLVMDALRRDVTAQMKKDQSPVDAILVTGDIAFSGAGRSPTEYEEAKAFLLGLADDAGVSAQQIFLVPGNHDVNRGVEGKDRNTKRLLEGLRSGRDQLDGVLADKGDRALLASRMAGYLAFAKDFAAVSSSEDGLFWVHRIAARGGLRMRLVGLNTALLAADDLDHGKLYLGRRQLSMALDKRIEEGELVMVLSHHPFSGGWLADERDADAWIRNNTHIHLSGHVHDADTEAARKGSGGMFVRIVAGSVHGDQMPKDVPASHGYSFGAVVVTDEGKPRLRIWPRRWSSKQTRFILDAESVPDDETYAEHELRLKLPPPVATPALDPPLATATPMNGPAALAPSAQAPQKPASAPASDAVEVFISSCPDDQALRGELETHLTPLKRQGLIKVTGSYSIGYGEDVRTVIEAQLRSARVILLLLSARYLSWEYCEVDLEIARERHTARTAQVIPVILSPVAIGDIQSSEAGKEWFAGLTRLPRNGTPVSKSDKDEALAQIAIELKKIVTPLRGR